MLRISYAITACNEALELNRLLSQLTDNIRYIDEIIVQVDTSVTNEVMDILRSYRIDSFVMFPLNDNFSEFKNNLLAYCKNDYIFQLDADEYLSDKLMNSMVQIVEENSVDVIQVSRHNIIENPTAEVRRKIWTKSILEDGNLIHFWEYQSRLFRNNNKIHWTRKVHEKLVGGQSSIKLPIGYDIIHYKTAEKYIVVNRYYDEIKKG